MVRANAEILKGFVCPKCRLLVSAKPDQLGVEVVCPNCSEEFRIPSLEVRAAALQPGVALPSEPSLPQEQTEVYVDDWRKDLPVSMLAERSGTLPWHMLIPAGLIGGFLFVVMLQLLGNTESKEPVRSEMRVAQSQFEVNKQSITQDHILQFFVQLGEVKELQDLMPLLREVPDLESKLQRFYSVEPLEFPTFTKVTMWEWSEMYQNAIQFRVSDERGQKNSGFLVVTPNGELRIDWETYAIYGDVPWDDLRKLQPKTAIQMRVVRKKVEYYNHSFDSERWQSFELTHPSSLEIYTGYAERGSEAELQLLPIGSDKDYREVIVHVRYPENPKSDQQIIIEKCMGEGWYIDDKE